MRAFVFLTVVILGLVLGTATLLRIKSEASIKATAISLIPLYARWLKEGKPSAPIMSNYVDVSTDQYRMDTNIYSVGGLQKTGLFLLVSTRLPAGEYLSVTKDGTVLRIRSSGEAAIVTSAYQH